MKRDHEVQRSPSRWPLRKAPRPRRTQRRGLSRLRDRPQLRLRADKLPSPNHCASRDFFSLLSLLPLGRSGCPGLRLQTSLSFFLSSSTSPARPQARAETLSRWRPQFSVTHSSPLLVFCPRFCLGRSFSCGVVRAWDFAFFHSRRQHRAGAARLS